jgi:hypothetical protein
MIEGFLRGRGRPPVPPSDLEVEAPHPQARSRRTLVWITFGILIVIAAGFGLRYYLTHREFLVSGQVLYKIGTQVRPVPAARIGVWLYPSGPDRDAHIQDPLYGLVHDPAYGLLRDRQAILNFGREMFQAEKEDQKEHPEWAKFNPYGANLAPLHLTPLESITGDDWWENERLTNCEYADEKFYESVGQQESVHTSTDMTGSFNLRLKPGVYAIVASSQVRTIVNDNSDYPRPATAAFWIERVTVAGDTKIVLANADCSPY